MLLARREPLKEPAALVKALLNRGHGPAIDGPGLLVADGRGWHPAEGPAGRPITTTLVKSSKGFVGTLFDGLPDGWLLVRAIAFCVKGAD